MKLKLAMWIASACCVVLYALVYGCEAVRYAGAFGFNEAITWTRFVEALGAVSMADFVNVWRYRDSLHVADIFTLGGAMLTATLAFRMHHAAWRNVAATILAAYCVVLVLLAGWGVLVAAYMLPIGIWSDAIDGEFFDDGVAARFVHGIWIITVAILAMMAWERKGYSTSQ